MSPPPAADPGPVLRAAAGGWRAVAATARGAAHERSGAPNQDAVALAAVPARSPGGGAAAGGALVAAVADGHGGPAYPRSDVGARLAVDVARTAAADLASDHLADDASGGQLARLVATTLVPEVVERWRRAVGEHAARTPLTRSQRRAAPDVLTAYGSTLLLAVAWARGVVVAQLGDGDVLAVTDQGDTSSPVAPDARLVAGVTTSLCRPGAAADARVVALLTAPPRVLVLASDGYGAAFADPGWRGAVGRDLAASLGDHDLDEVAGALPGWLADSARVGGDDVSVLLVHRAGPRGR